MRLLFITNTHTWYNAHALDDYKKLDIITPQRALSLIEQGWPTYSWQSIFDFNHCRRNNMSDWAFAKSN